MILTKDANYPSHSGSSASCCMFPYLIKEIDIKRKDGELLVWRITKNVLQLQGLLPG